MTKKKKKKKLKDFLTYGDQNGLTKLDVLYALEQVILEHGLYDEAIKRLDKETKESNDYLFENFCQDCGVPKEKKVKLKDFTDGDGNTVKLCGPCHKRAGKG